MLVHASRVRQSAGAFAALAFGMRIELESFSDLHAVGTRRDFLRLIGVGGALVLLPGFVSACGSNGDSISSPGSGLPVVIDFAAGDVAILQLAYVLEQLEADFYGRVVAAFAGSNITTTEQAVLTDIRNHEVVHRALLETALGAGLALTITPSYSGLAFNDRNAVLPFAKKIEELGIATYNGAAQYITSSDTLTLLAKIAAVEGRHASFIGDMATPRTDSFAPLPADNVFRPAKVGATVQANLVDKLGFSNLPDAFVEGPNNNG
jgi:ferritin-like protein